MQGSSLRPAAPPTRAVRVSEIFESLQGEGPTAGAPCLFVRLAACNLRCRWCDTTYSWDFRRFAYNREVSQLDLDQVVDRVHASKMGRVVFTGGEPLLQQRAIAEILRRIETAYAVEVETNGTLLPSSALASRVDQWNVSPKLPSAGDAEDRRIRPEALAALRETGRAWLKLVVDDDDDLAQADALIESLSWPRQRVLLMACAQTREQLRLRSRKLAPKCISRGVGLSPRLHLEWFDGERGR
jgi:organic radical activating enzyme